ncbi:hypothetical protein MPY17_33395 [Rhodococcus opacus]|uniref:hypothetical protein n=1 Tax=Rhodococcus opacus TaxID=37919 RepID=UPI001FF3F255|nr:hypothetical protein [Rhodococcus opacus]UOT03750.1 hypothetical protein MPY17_33395 [Rhodococcus opacus]
MVRAWDQQLPTLVACLGTTLRRIGRAPTYLLTDNPRTVMMDRIAGVPVRHPDIVSAGKHYGCVVHTCEPFDPESKGGAEHTVNIAKVDLVPTEANLIEEHPRFAELVDACARWCDKVDARPHGAVGAAPAERLATELSRLHVLPEDPHLLALGEERLVGFDQTISWGNVRYSTPDGHQPAKVWCRVTGDELVIVARTGTGVAEIARHRLSTPGNPRILRPDFSRGSRRPDRLFRREYVNGSRTARLRRGIIPISLWSRRWLNQSMYSATANSRSSIDFHRPLFRISSASNSELNASAIAVSNESPRLPTEATAPASARRWVYRVVRY